MNKLNLGCGAYKKQGYVNVDGYKKYEPEVLHDLNVFPYPFQDDYFDVIEADHILEHLEQPLRVICELHRITRKGATITIRCPHFSRGFTHSEHKRGFDVSLPYYFNPRFLGRYSGQPTLELVSMRLRWNAQPYLKKQIIPRWQFWGVSAIGRVIDLLANLSPTFCSRFWCFWVGGI